MRERRSQPRLHDAELVMLCWQGGNTQLKQLANVEDVSLKGLGVLVQDDLPVGTAVTISYEEEAELAGVVRHHAEREEGYWLGIELVDNCQDLLLQFHPALLMRPV